MGAGCYLVTLKNRESRLVIMGKIISFVYQIIIQLFYFIGRQISLPQQHLAVCCLCVPLLLMVGASSAIFWSLGK